MRSIKLYSFSGLDLSFLDEIISIDSDYESSEDSLVDDIPID